MPIISEELTKFSVGIVGLIFYLLVSIIQKRGYPSSLIESLKESKMVSSNILLSLKIRFANLKFLKKRNVCAGLSYRRSAYIHSNGFVHKHTNKSNFN